MKNIVWLASYPKSGNTWFRIFLINLLRDEDKPVDINKFGHTIPIASANNIFDDALGFDIADLSYEEADQLRSEIYEFEYQKVKDTSFIKIHDAFSYNNNFPIVPLSVTKCSIYFIRNPLDIAVSFANHSGISIDKSIARMNDASYCFCDKTDRYQNQLRQRLFSWSGHVKSWVNAENINFHIIRFEDMKQYPLETFSEAVKFAGLKKNQDDIQKALKFSSFDEMQRQEQENGFSEKALDCKLFFNKGQSGYWRDILTDNQIEAVINKHEKVMAQFGYLNSNQEPV